MGKILVIAEKPSLGRSIAGAISWWKGEKFERQGIVGSPYDLIPYDKELNEATAKRKATRTRKRKDLGEDSEKSNSKLEQIEIPDIPDEDPDDEDDD